VRRQHQAMDTAFSQDRVLFPLQAHLPRRHHPTPTDARLRLFNPLIGTNAPQLQAVTSIVHQAPGAVPFVIFGPYVLQPLQISKIVLTLYAIDQERERQLQWWKLSSRCFVIMQTLVFLHALRAILQQISLHRV
jgi:hypothetical protein